MLPKKNRNTRESFMETMKKGRVIHSTFFLLRYLIPIQTTTPPYGAPLLNKEGKTKFSVVAPKSMEKTAVGRNYLRRKVYAMLQSYKDKVKIGSQVLIFLKKESKKASSEELKKEIEITLKKSSLL